MAFWSSETLKQRIPDENLVAPYDEKHVTRCAYELCMGAEAFITSTSDKTKVKLEGSDSLVIPPGQFALLLTDEKVKVPLDSIAFISMRFGVKRRGLINVSGFHVDPGFDGRLKFSVYNAGSSPITVSRNDRLFLIWYAKLDSPTSDGYGVSNSEQNHISSDDQNVMHGDIASPAELKSQLDELKHFGVNLKWIYTLIAGVCIATCTRFFFMDDFGIPSSSDIERMRQKIVVEIKEELNIANPSASATEEISVNSGSAPSNKNRGVISEAK